MLYLVELGALGRQWFLLVDVQWDARALGHDGGLDREHRERLSKNAADRGSYRKGWSRGEREVGVRD